MSSLVRKIVAGVIVIALGVVGGPWVYINLIKDDAPDQLRLEPAAQTAVETTIADTTSAFGLNAAAGVMRYLEERGIGYDTGVAKVPIVPAAVIFDLGVGSAAARPDAEMGYAACQAASAGLVEEGNAGAGMGASVGKVFGVGRAMKGGLGTALRRAGGLSVGALVVVNALGDVVEPASGQIIAGTRALTGAGFADSTQAMAGLVGRSIAAFAGNTVIGVVATDAGLTKAQAHKVAQMAHDGLARAIRPAHTMFDGDTIFALATGRRAGNVTLIGALAAEALAEAIVRGVRAAHSAGGLPAANP